MPPMTEQQLTEFLERPLIVSMTTIRPDGSPHVSPAWYEYEHDRFFCIVGTDSVKARNIRGDPRVALCIATHDEPYKYVLAEGTCEIIMDSTEQWCYSICTRYRGKKRGEKYARELMEQGDMVVLVVTPTKVVSERVA